MQVGCVPRMASSLLQAERVAARALWRRAIRTSLGILCKGSNRSTYSRPGLLRQLPMAWLPPKPKAPEHGFLHTTSHAIYICAAHAVSHWCASWAKLPLCSLRRCPSHTGQPLRSLYKITDRASKHGGFSISVQQPVSPMKQGLAGCLPFRARSLPSSSSMCDLRPYFVR